jgi:N-acetylneuraminic acid mutarotase
MPAVLAALAAAAGLYFGGVVGSYRQGPQGPDRVSNPPGGVAGHAVPPLNRWASAPATLTHRYYLAATTGADGRLYAFGGMRDDGAPGPGSWVVTDTVESYRPAEQAWRMETPMPTARWAPAAVTARDGRIYVIGGKSESNLTAGGSDVPLDTVEVYTPGKGTWTTAASLPVPLAFARAVLGRDGRLYAIGASMTNGEYADTLEIYDPQSDTWTIGPPPPTPRGRALVAAGRDGRVYVISGERNRRLSRIVEAYEPASGSWSRATPMPAARYETAAVTGPDGRIYVPGGQSTYAGAAQSSVYVYTPQTDTWTMTMPLPVARYSQTAALGPDRRIYVIGGETGSTNEHSGITTRVDVLTSAGGASSPNPYTGNPPRSGADLLTFAGSGFSIGYPSSWSVASSEAQKPGFVDTTIRDPADPAKTTYIRIDYSPAVNTSLESAAEEQRGNHRANAPGYREISYQPTELAGRPGIRWEFEELQSRVLVHKVDTFAIDDAQRGFAVLTQAPVATYSHWSPTFEAVLASFSLG